jgi:hypothetical protein
LMIMIVMGGRGMYGPGKALGDVISSFSCTLSCIASVEVFLITYAAQPFYSIFFFGTLV